MAKDLKLTGMNTVSAESERGGFSFGEKIEKYRPRLLLHSCCGPCSTACIERLSDNYKVTVFYYNPNITDRDEYELRKANQLKFINEYNAGVTEENRVEFIEGEYITEDYFKAVKGLEDEPEGGKRCTECFRLRLERTALVALETGNEIFGTTLTVSPHKNYPLISAIGTEIGERLNIDFLDVDFKKRDGYKRSIELSKEYGLYRQNYCGCEFSKWFEKEASEENTDGNTDSNTSDNPNKQNG